MAGTITPYSLLGNADLVEQELKVLKDFPVVTPNIPWLSSFGSSTYEKKYTASQSLKQTHLQAKEALGSPFYSVSANQTVEPTDYAFKKTYEPKVPTTRRVIKTPQYQNIIPIGNIPYIDREPGESEEQYKKRMEIKNFFVMINETTQASDLLSRIKMNQTNLGVTYPEQLQENVSQFN